MTMGKQSNCVAVDIGASGGRVVVGSLNSGKLSFTPVISVSQYTPLAMTMPFFGTFKVSLTPILQGLQSQDISLKTIQSLGIDTWGVDYVIADADGTHDRRQLFLSRRTHKQ